VKNKSPLIALLAAALFGASAPFAKILLQNINPWWLSAILYLGSGLGVSIIFIKSKLTNKSALFELTKKDLPWLLGSILFGGILGPTLLMYGLSQLDGTAGSLLLNMEGVFTAFLAWFIFKEHFDKKIFIGMLFILCGGFILSLPPNIFSHFEWNSISSSTGSLLILGACLSWGIDNNLTRNISASNPYEITAIKSLIAGTTNAFIAWSLSPLIPPAQYFALGSLVGFLGYGLGLILFVHSLRTLGTSRTSAYFATAPFVGAILSLLILNESLHINLLISAIFMGLGVWLHLTESHSHEHHHHFMEHQHEHTHDEHHNHTHEPHLKVDPKKPHSHWHSHEPIVHAHAHYPDIHHRHEHQDDGEHHSDKHQSH
jgi:drug/metabolite transporter (DMT)-like permease